MDPPGPLRLGDISLLFGLLLDFLEGVLLDGSQDLLGVVL